jgi:hypothetical protein
MEEEVGRTPVSEPQGRSSEAVHSEDRGQDAANHPDVISSIAANACLLPTPALREGCETLARPVRTFRPG